MDAITCPNCDESMPIYNTKPGELRVAECSCGYQEEISDLLAG